MSRQAFRRLAPLLALATAWGARAAEAPAAARVVELPPFLVSDSRVPLHWRYGGSGGYEVLSVCSDDTTREFIGQINRLHQELRFVLPAEFQVSQSLPVTYILCNEDVQQRLERDIPAELLARQEGAAPTPPMSDPRTTFHVLPNMRLADPDAYTVFALVNESQLAQSQLILAPDHVLDLLEQRVPLLPLWFVSGFMYLYGSITLPAAYDPYVNDPVTLAPFVWISPAETAELIKHPPAASPLLPMEDLLVARHPPDGPPEAAEHYRRAWISQAALFIRWALDDKTPAAQRAFWTLVNRAATEPVTEAMCRDAFGLTTAQLREQLVRYLAAGARHRIFLHQEETPAPAVELHDATDLEIARIKGDWERLETAFVKQSYPALSGQYLAQARRTFRRAYDHGERDPRLLAAMGLCECDAGDDAAALPFLTAATGAQVVRPRAYFELARILYGQASAAPGAPQGRLSAAQTASVAGILAAGRKQSPPLLAGYALLADVWFHSSAALTPTDLAPLEEGVRLFPHFSGLAYNVALLETRAGRPAVAAEIINHDLDLAPDDANRERMIALREFLRKAK
jgi:hypothetical protein